MTKLSSFIHYKQRKNGNSSQELRKSKKYVHFNFKLNDEAKFILERADELNKFARWFGLTNVSFDTERRQSDLGRLLHYLPEHASAFDEQQIINFVYRPEEEMTPEAQRLINIRKALQFCRVTEENYGTPLLQKLHAILSFKLAMEDESGRVRNNGENPSASMVRALLDDFTALSIDQSIHPLIRVWLLYYYIYTARFFNTHNEVLAIIFCYYFLQREGYGYRHLLKLEKYVLHSKKFMAYSMMYFKNNSFDQGNTLDLSNFLSICLQGFDQNLNAINEKYLLSVKKQLEYSLLKPRQKNAVNYWLEKGFKLHQGMLSSLNPRQREILYQLYTQVELSTSSLAIQYNVDKKTIQDEIAVLLNCGIASLKGSGKEMRFTLNFI